MVFIIVARIIPQNIRRVNLCGRKANTIIDAINTMFVRPLSTLSESENKLEPPR